MESMTPTYAYDIVCNVSSASDKRCVNQWLFVTQPKALRIRGRRDLLHYPDIHLGESYNRHEFLLNLGETRRVIRHNFSGLVSRYLFLYLRIDSRLWSVPLRASVMDRMAGRFVESKRFLRRYVAILSPRRFFDNESRTKILSMTRAGPTASGKDMSPISWLNSVLHPRAIVYGFGIGSLMSLLECGMERCCAVIRLVAFIFGRIDFVGVRRIV